jgi:hypothetical protein
VRLRVPESLPFPITLKPELRNRVARAGLNPTYQRNCGVDVLPARPRKPRDKSRVEAGVKIAECWIIAALRHRQFFSLGELNSAIRELLEKLNERPFKERQGSRRSRSLEIEQGALRPLRTERFALSEWSQATVNIDYRIQFERRFPPSDLLQFSC